jgi:Bacterial Ig domain
VPEYIYSYNISGTPAQIAASAQIVYTMPTTTGDTNANRFPYIGGLALDPTNHYLYFDQWDTTTSTNSYIGRLSLASSSVSDTYSLTTNLPTLQTFYAGQIPGVGPIAIDASNIYLGLFNTVNGTNGVYSARISGAGGLSEIVAVSTNDTTFPNGFIAGVASFPQSNLVYYLTCDLGVGAYTNSSVSQNAIWTYNTVSHVRTLIASGYPGIADNIALDVPNNRYYFTTGNDGTGNSSPTNYEAIYTGVLGSTSAPILFYAPVLSGLDTTNDPGNVAIQGIYIVDAGGTSQPPVAGSNYLTADENQMLAIPVTNLLADATDPNSYPINITSVSATSTNGGNVSLSSNFVDYTPATNYIGNDQFTYTLTDSHNAQSLGTVRVNVVALSTPPSNHISIAIVPTGRFILFTGAPNQGGIVEYANTLTGPWYYLSPTITAGASGVIEYNDLTAPAPPTRFYLIQIVP